MSATASHEVSEALGLWEPKRTLTLEAARRHSVRIKIIRVILIALAGLLIVALFWQFSNQSSGPLVNESPDESVKMINPRYSGRTDDGLPFFLTAGEAVRRNGNEKLVELINPVLHFYREAGVSESLIAAETGTYDDVEKILNLRTTVNLTTDDGTTCVSTHARIFARTKVVEGDEPIKCDGAFGKVNGNAYEILENYTVFVFKDGMDAVLDQDERSASEGTPQ